MKLFLILIFVCNSSYAYHSITITNTKTSKTFYAEFESINNLRDWVNKNKNDGSFGRLQDISIGAETDISTRINTETTKKQRANELKLKLQSQDLSNAEINELLRKE